MARLGEARRCGACEIYAGGGLRRVAPPDDGKSAEPGRYQNHLVFKQGKAS